MDYLKEYLGLAVALLAVIAAWFSLKAKVREVEVRSLANKQDILNLQEDVNQLEKNESANNATRDQMLSMLQENRLDVKQILQQIATIAANQRNEKES